ncbi:hypothetical protein EG68_05004 [Paragonimus skrjabini miyazakii]|uniref:Uncharacterized protein n=1 Tax=Paragonimus skrjabini miyazakii TaxID=59628 RepID=A0A8S9YT49_9TREM|nr:hypothetical protein EG68_05004 [Paragonimus skrjabini miyazakii]
MFHERVVQPRKVTSSVGRIFNGYEFITQDQLFRVQKPRSSIPAYGRSKDPAYNLCVSGPWKSLPPSAERLQTDVTQTSVCQPIFCNVLCEPTPYVTQKSQVNSVVGSHRTFHAITENHYRDGRQFNIIGQKAVLATREPFLGWDVQVAQNVKHANCLTNRRSSNPARQSWTLNIPNSSRASILKPIATTPKRLLHFAAPSERGRLNTKALWEPRTNSQSDYAKLVFATDSMQVTQRSDRRTH